VSDEPTPGAAKRPLCGKHGEEWLEWLTAKQPPGAVMLVGQAAADLTARSVADRQARRAEEWRQVCRQQTEMIARFCAEGRNCGPSTPERVLALPMPDSSVGATTVRGYLCQVLATLWHEGESFSYYRPFVGSYDRGSMDQELIDALEDSGQFGLSKDPRNSGSSEDKARGLIAAAIRLLGEGR
jgi:hypothetical protein